MFQFTGFWRLKAEFILYISMCLFIPDGVLVGLVVSPSLISVLTPLYWNDVRIKSFLYQSALACFRQNFLDLQSVSVCFNLTSLFMNSSFWIPLPRHLVYHEMCWLHFGKHRVCMYVCIRIVYYKMNWVWLAEPAEWVEGEDGRTMFGRENGQ